MYYFPFVDLIRSLINWAKQYTWWFWLSTTSSSLVIVLSIKAWEETGRLPRTMFIVGVGLFTANLIGNGLFPKLYFKGKKKDENKDGSSNSKS